LNLVPVKTPSLVKKCYPNYVWNVETNEKVLYLTFDDGPTPNVTDFVLDQLRQYNAKATFFCIGANVKKNPEIYKRTISEGHAIGNHTMNHTKGWKVDVSEYLEDVTNANSVFQTTLDSNSNEILSSSSKIFRPPYGKIKKAQARQLTNLGYKIIMWDILSFDWSANVSEEECLENVISKSKPGSIIVFHDSLKASKNMMYALPKILEYFSGKGYKFEKITA